MAHPGRNNIYEATIRRMVNAALEAQEQAFRQEHGSDTGEQLLAYLRECAHRLGHTPWPREIVGGCMIEERFGTWQDALAKANLPPPNTPDLYHSFTRVQEETERQKILYREKKVAKKERHQQRLKAQKEKQKIPSALQMRMYTLVMAGRSTFPSGASIKSKNLPMDIQTLSAILRPTGRNGRTAS